MGGCSPHVDLMKGFYPIVDSTFSTKDAVTLMESLLSVECPVIQLRQKNLTHDAFLDLAREVAYLRVHHQFKLIINQWVDIAKSIGADGVHLTSQSGPVSQVRELLGNHCLIGVSVHSIEDGVNRCNEGADYLTFGSIYSSSSKPANHPIQGLEKLKELIQSVSIPVVAIGGIRAENLTDIKYAGAKSFTILGDLMRAERPGEYYKKMQEMWKNLH